MKKLLMFAMVSATLGLTGCYDSSNPTSVIESAGYSIHTNDLARFRAVLTPEMRASYWGTQEGLNDLRARSNGQNCSVSQLAYVSKATCGGNCSDSTYAANVVRADGSTAATVYVTCRTQYRDGHKNMKFRESRCKISNLAL